MGNPRWYKDGIFAGYPDYRYARGEHKPVPLVKKAEKPIYSTGKRKHLVSRLVDEMTDWRSTPFENEAGLVHGIRSQLCLEGYSWNRSDTEARFLVGQALKRIGVPRPAWAEGQRGYVDSPDRCAWCAKPIEDIGNGKASRYCSAVCAKSALESRQICRSKDYDKAYAAAERVIRKSRTKTRHCAFCGNPFQPIREKSKQRFCSFSCGARGRACHAPMPNLHAAAVTLSCIYCGANFQARAKNAITCSKACNQTRLKMNRGRHPKMLKAHVFDHFFTLPVNDVPSISPQAFDHLTREAA